MEVTKTAFKYLYLSSPPLFKRSPTKNSHRKPVHLLEAKLKHQNGLKKWGPTWEIKTLLEFSFNYTVLTDFFLAQRQVLMPGWIQRTCSAEPCSILPLLQALRLATCWAVAEPCVQLASASSSGEQESLASNLEFLFVMYNHQHWKIH